MHEVYQAWMFFFCLLETFNERMKNPTSASSVWRNSENIFHILAYQIPATSKSYQARNTKNKVFNFIGTKC